MLVETIICYCVCDDLLKALGYVDDPQCKMGSAEVITADGDLWEFIVTPASVADITALRNMDLDLPENATLFADRAYNHYAFEEEIAVDAKISLIAQRKRNSNALIAARYLINNGHTANG